MQDEVRLEMKPNMAARGYVDGAWCRDPTIRPWSSPGSYWR